VCGVGLSEAQAGASALSFACMKIVFGQKVNLVERKNSSLVNNLVNIDSKELKDLVGSTIDNIEESLKGRKYKLSKSIDFEVAVVNLKKAEGGLKLLVVGASGKYAKENITKIKFQIVKDRSGAFSFG